MRFFLKSKNARAARHAKTPIPPATPPTMGPIGTFLSLCSTVIGSGAGVDIGGTGAGDDELVLVTVELVGNGGGFRVSVNVAVNVYRSELQPKFEYVFCDTTNAIKPQNGAVAAVQ